MGRFEFAELLNSHLEEYIYIFLLLSIIYIIVFKRLFISIIDPFIVSQIFSLFASSVVYFLGYLNLIKLEYILQFTLSQIFLWIGIFVYSPKKLIRYVTHSDAPMYKSKISRQTYLLFYNLSFLFIFTQLLVYYKYGIPLFLDSRLSLYADSGGGGIFGRILNVLSILVFVGGFYIKKLSIKTSVYNKNFVNFILVFYIITLILSGSKSTLLNFFFLYFLCVLFFAPDILTNIKKHQYKIILIVIVGALFVIGIQSQSQSGGILLLIDRLVGSGDVFYQGYYKDRISSIEGNAFSLLFTDILGTYRIIPWSELPKPIGMQLYSMTYNVDLDMGANARHNYLGLICFGYFGSIVFSFTLGVIISWIRHFLFFKIKKYNDFIICSFYIYLLLSVSYIESDFTMFVNALNSYILVMGILFAMLIISFVIFYFINKLRFSKI